MPRSSYFLGLSMLAIGCLSSCDKTNAPDADPSPTICFPPMPATTCYSGTVVATTCMLGVLVDVDPAYPIGARAVSVYGNRFLGNNVVSVANSGDLQSLGRVGQRLHFTYTSAQTNPGMVCLAADGTTTPVPIVTLRNVSAVSCDSARTH